MKWHGMRLLHFICVEVKKMRMEFNDEIVALFSVLQDMRLYDFPADGLLIYFYFSFTSRERFSACGFRVCVYPFFSLAKRSTPTYLIGEQISRVFSIHKILFVCVDMRFVKLSIGPLVKL